MMDFTKGCDEIVPVLDPPGLDLDAEEYFASVGVGGSFEINDHDSADWVVGLLAANEHEIRDIERQAAKRLAKARAEKDRLERRFLVPLERWAKDNRPRHGKEIDFTRATGVLRIVPGSLSVSDKGEAIAWAAVHQPTLLSVVAEARLDGAAYNKLARQARDSTGELLPGCEVKLERETFRIEFVK
jgi:hypothetical protein